jgi:FMN reductase
MTRQPFIVALGGTASPQSSTEQALRLAIAAAEKRGARVALFTSDVLTALPHYTTPACMDNAHAIALVDAIRQADGLILASPGYHGTVSGLVKNAIDYFEETAKDRRVYVDGLPVGLIATAYGWQAAGNTLATLRNIVHALRGWPTPFGAALNTSGGVFKNGVCHSETVAAQLDLIGKQVFEFAQRHAMGDAAAEAGAVLSQAHAS